MNKKIFMSTNGFSLIELMVVVAIIGILAAIAVPNYTKFQVKARESEAKSTLGGIYMAEKAYIQEAVGSTNNLLRSGYTPDGGVLFNCGFSAVAQTQGNNDPSTPAQDYRDTVSSGYCGNATFAPSCTWKATFTATNSAIPAGYAAPGIASPLFAVACIGNVGGAVVPVWAIDQNNNMTNPTAAF